MTTTPTSSSSVLATSKSSKNSLTTGGAEEKWILVALATMATAGMLYYIYRNSKETESVEYDELGKPIVKKDPKPTGKSSNDPKATKSTTTSTTSLTKDRTTPDTTAKDSTEAKTTTATSSATTSTGALDEKQLHAMIEEMDKKGKVLFKNKQYLEAATAFTEAIDLILQQTGIAAHKDVSSSLVRQQITLLNNRSAMYEKANILELALEDCASILERDVNHNKARIRKLRLLEQLKRHNDALIEVCAIQLLFMQANRTNLRMGLPLPPPPVPQSKMEELLSEILPAEMNKFIIDLENKRKGTSNDKLGKLLPSVYTILQLLRSYTGYNSWMASAAKDGSISKLSAEIPATTPDNEALATKAIILLKRGRRYVYERNYELASQDFEDAYKLVEDNTDVQTIMQQSSVEVNAYARLLEWTGMVRHWHYELESAIACYEKCAALEPSNAIILVKQAGVQLDASNHEKALELFDKALSIDPNTVDALLHRSNLRMMQGNPQLAQVDLEQCIKIRPNYVMARLRLAAILATTDGDAAKRQLDIAEQSEPNSSEIHSYRGEVYFTQGDMELAVQQFEKAMTLEPSNPTPYVNAAMAVLNTPPTASNPIPDTKKVISLLERAVEIDPQFTAAYIHLGQLKLGTATDLQTAREVIKLYDQGLENCRTPDEIKELCGMRCLAIAQVEAATQLNMETFNSM